MSEADRAHLTQTLGIKTIIDLRSKTEHIKVAKKYEQSASAISDSAITPPTERHTGCPIRMAGINRVGINLNGGAFERALLFQLKYISLARLVWLMMLGYREDAISILGREVMTRRGLIGLGKDTLDYSTSEIKEVFSVLANEDNYPLLVHCTQGKDRTGLIVLLVLTLCEVGQAAIDDDYMRSEEELEVEKESRLQEIWRIGLNEEFAGCPDRFVNEMIGHLQERYGGVEKYLNGCGIGTEARKSVKKAMLQQATETETLSRMI